MGRYAGATIRGLAEQNYDLTRERDAYRRALEVERAVLSPRHNTPSYAQCCCHNCSVRRRIDEVLWEWEGKKA